MIQEQEAYMAKHAQMYPANPRNPHMQHCRPVVSRRNIANGLTAVAITICAGIGVLLWIFWK